MPVPIVFGSCRCLTGSFGVWLGAVFGDFLPGFFSKVFVGEFDPGSGRTLAACLTHASRTMKPSGGLVANG